MPPNAFEPRDAVPGDPKASLPVTLHREFTTLRPALLPTNGAGTAKALAFGPDSRLLALGGDRATVDLWDSYEGQQVAELSGHHRSPLFSVVASLAFGPNGMLASGGWDNTVRLWSQATGECVNVLTGFSGGVQRLAFSSSAPLLAAVDKNSVRLFDLGTGTDRPLTLTDRGINGFAFSPDASLPAVAAGGSAWRGTHPVTLFDSGSGQVVRQLGQGNFAPRSLAFSPDGRSLAIGLRGGDIQLWDTVGWQPARTLRAASSALWLAYSSRGVLGAAREDRVCLWDAAAESKPVSPKTRRIASGL